MFALMRKLFTRQKSFTVKDAERLCIARAKEAGAYQYVTVDVGRWDGTDARKFGERAKIIVEAKYPGALPDPDLSEWGQGRLVLLLPVTPNVGIQRASPASGEAPLE